MTASTSTPLGRGSLKSLSALLLTGLLMSCSDATTTPTPTPTPAPVAVLARPDALVFSSVVTCPTPSKCPDGIESLTITNSGVVSTKITGWYFDGLNPSEFEVLTPGALPVTMTPGEVITVRVRLKSGSSAGVFKASLNAIGTTFAPVALAGLRALGMEGVYEPPLAQIVNTLGIKVNVGNPPDPSKPLELGTAASLIGDEVLAPLFVKAGTGAVSVTPVARYSPDGVTPFGFFTVSGGAAMRTGVGAIPAGQYQTLNPSGGATFDPGAASFGMYIDPAAYGYRLTYTQDDLNEGKTKHAVRVYPLKDSTGQAVANAYLLAFEPSVNGDYQDAVFVIRNVKPAR